MTSYTQSLAQLAQRIVDLEAVSEVDEGARKEREAAIRELVSRIIAAQADA